MSVSAANMWVTIFIVIKQMGVSSCDREDKSHLRWEMGVTIMQVVFSAVNYAHDSFYVIMQVTLS